MISHDKLQSSAHMYLWNEHSELRGLFHTNFNDIKIIESMVRRFTGTSISSVRRLILSALKTIGLVKGTFDHELFYKGVLYYFDAKVGQDKLSKEQKEFKKINEKHGAKCYEYRSLEGFKLIIERILSIECPRCFSNEDVRIKPTTHDCVECGYTYGNINL